MSLRRFFLRWWVLLGLLALLVGGILVLMAQVPVPARSDTAVCPEGWWKQPDRAFRDHCAALEATDTANFIQAELATAAQLPTLTPGPTVTPDPRPAMPVPTVTIPEGLLRVTAIHPAEAADGPPLLRGNSIWQLGAVHTPDGRDFSTIQLLAHPPRWGNPAWIDLLPGEFTNAELMQRYARVWVPATDIGRISITQVTDVQILPVGVAGTLTFTTTTGVTGTLDLQQDFVVLKPAPTTEPRRRAAPSGLPYPAPDEGMTQQGEPYPAPAEGTPQQGEPYPRP